MSRVLLCQTPNTQLPELGPALVKSDHQLAALIDLSDLSNLEQVADLGPVDLCILDASCSIDGSTCCYAFSEAYPEIPSILLIAKDEHVDRECRKLTGSNVLRMPFTPRKVTNRIAKLANCRLGNILTAGEISLNLDKRCVYRGDAVHRLTPRQAKLLEVFISNAGRTLTRKYLMKNVWDTDYVGDTRTLDVHVRWLRERIEERPSSPLYLRTVRGVGYRFGVPGEDD
ncbi:MAG: response regulator transcription factor [Anaerolineae bacterium]|nr:response regulator transcription factor [Anaerolineae bacterium]